MHVWLIGGDCWMMNWDTITPSIIWEVIQLRKLSTGSRIVYPQRIYYRFCFALFIVVKPSLSVIRGVMCLICPYFSWLLHWNAPVSVKQTRRMWVKLVIKCNNLNFHTVKSLIYRTHQTPKLKGLYLALQLSLPNPLKPGIKSKMKISTDRRCSNYIWVNSNFIAH